MEIGDKISEDSQKWKNTLQLHFNGRYEGILPNELTNKKVKTFDFKELRIACR